MRPRSVFPLSIASISAVVVVAAACIGKDPYNPGTPLGTFAVDAHVTANGCMAVNDPWDFSVKLSEDPGVLYWVQNDVPVSGNLQADGSFTMSSTSTLTVTPPTGDGGGASAGCLLQRDDTLQGTTSGTPITAVSGTLSYRYSVLSGECGSQLASAGGQYAAIPCTVSYKIGVTQTAPPPDASTK